MAVQPWELDKYDPIPRPRLRVVPAPAPPRGRVIPAIAFILFVVLLLGAPALSAEIFSDDTPMTWAQRALPAVEIPALDPIEAVPRGALPASRNPVLGFAFVRCTRLWTALPDGSHARKIIEMEGISSPAFAPNARTIAFFVDAPSGNQEIWAAAADGSGLRRVGEVTGGGLTPKVRATGLAWSPDGSRLAFALVDGYYDEFEGGSALWSLDLRSGQFQKEGSGWPAPFFVDNDVAFAGYEPIDEVSRFTTPYPRQDYILRDLRTFKGGDLSVARVPDKWWHSEIQRNGVAVLKSNGKLLIKDLYKRNARYSVQAPQGYRFDQYARPAIAQDASTVAIAVVDKSGERDLALLDTSTRRWRVRDYAWDPAASPAPVVTGDLERSRALDVAADLLGFWTRDGIQRRLMSIETPASEIPFEGGLGYLTKSPRKTEDGWVVPATVYSYDRPQEWLEVEIDVTAHHRRMTAEPHAITPVQPLDDVGDAAAFAESALERDVTAPVLPAGWTLRPSSLYAYSYNGSRTINLNVKPPSDRTDTHGSPKSMGFGYGDDLDFELGCGSTGNPKPLSLDGVPAMVSSSGGTHQVIWPGDKLKDKATHTVYGYGVPKKFLIETARQMATRG